MSYPSRSYDQILNLSIRHCEVHGGNKHEGQVDEILVRWRPWVPPDSDDEDSEDHRLGIERAVLFRMAIGPQCEGRHNVSIAAWYAPTRLDTEDMTEIGMLIDEGNQAMLTPGEKVVFKFPKIRVRCCGNPTCKKRFPISIAIVAELRPGHNRVSYNFLPGEDVGRMTISEIVSGYSVDDVNMANGVKDGYVPLAPPPKRKRQYTIQEACAVAAARGKAKRAKAAPSAETSEETSTSTQEAAPTAPVMMPETP